MAIKSSESITQRWEDIYQGTPLRELPWEEGKPSAQLVELIESGVVEKGSALDVCCGSGNNTIYLASKGFICYGIDISPTAIGYAREKASAEGKKCDLTTGNVLRLRTSIIHSPWSSTGAVFTACSRRNGGRMSTASLE